MVTLLRVTTSDGTRRCDARCYNAKRPNCDCICGGRNHGVGREQAHENMRALVADLAERAGDRALAAWLSEMQIAVPIALDAPLAPVTVAK